MIPIGLIFVLPLVLAVLGLFPGAARWLPKAAAAIMGGQALVVLAVCLPAFSGRPAVWGDFAIDGLGAAFTCITTLVAACSLGQAAFLLPSGRAAHPMSDRRYCLFYTLAALFLVAMYAVPLAQNLGFLWIALEATTLMSAPLVDFYGTQSALEATWKYLILCSVGIAFALFGTVLIFAAQHGSPSGTLSLATLTAQAKSLDPRILRAGFTFCLLGYGTKAGIFPLHNWLPDAHSEAPAPVSAMLSGALLNCALVAIWRVSQVVVAAGQGDFVRSLLVPAGAITVLAASLMLIRQHDLKRMWAYSSVEHVGLLVVAIGMNAGPIFVLHAFNHSLVKTALFLMSGNVLEVLGTRSLSKLSGILRMAPVWGMVIVGCGFAIAGSPPFGTFLSEWLLLKATFSGDQVFASIALLAGLTIAFLAISSHVSKLTFGTERTQTKMSPNSTWASMPAGLLAVSFVAGIAVTPATMSMLRSLFTVVAR